MMKTSLLSVALLLHVFSCVSQSLCGCFREYNPGIADSEARYWFYEDGTFRYESADDTGNRIGMGEYFLTADSIVFSFSEIPEWIKETRIISQKIIGESDTGASAITLINPWNKNTPVPFNYQIFDNEKLFERGESDDVGRASLFFKEGQTLKIWEAGFSSNSILSYPLNCNLIASSSARDYVIFDAGFVNKPAAIESRTMILQLKQRLRRGIFKVKDYRGWVTYIKCNS